MSRSLGALLAAPADAGAQTVLVSDEIDARAWTCPASTRVPKEDLAKKIRARRGAVLVVATCHVGPTLMRALREFPPELLVITGDLTPNQVADLTFVGEDDGTRLLGPRAVLRITDGPAPAQRHDRGPPLLCATGSQEIDQLGDAIGAHLIALAPTPRWLPAWLDDDLLSTTDAIGYVPWVILDLHWRARPRDMLVPLGVETPPLDISRHAALDRAVAVHAIEIRTGPVYPDPRVLAAIYQGIRRGVSSAAAPEASHPLPQALQLWQQASRALPHLGALLGMQAPLPGLDLDTPTASFLAQRALLHIAGAEQTLAADFEPPTLPAETIRDRAMAVLAGGDEVLSEHESKVVLRGFGVEITRQAVANSASGAASFADRIGYPVALKVVTPDLQRKADLGAVELDLPNAAAVKRGYSTIVHNVETRAPTARIDGIAVAEMIEPGQEFRCGGLRMRGGEVALYGQPVGLLTRIEPVFALASDRPADALLLAHALLSRLPVPARRRASDPDAQTLATLFLRLHRLFETTQDRLLSVDLSPIRLVASERRYVTLDARIVQRAHLEGQ